MSSIEQILPIFREILELPDLVFEINQRLDVIQRHLNSIYGVEGASVDLSGVDHGALVGKDDDDHSIYHTDARGDARYLKLSGGIMTGNVTIPDGGTIGQTAGPLLTFDDTNDDLNISGCDLKVAGDIHGLNIYIDRPTDGSVIFQASDTNKFLVGYDSSPDGFRIYDYQGTPGAKIFIASGTGNVDIVDHDASTVGLKLGGTLITASAAEINHSDGVTSLIQTQLDARCLESVFGTSISTGLLLDGTALKVSAILQKYHAIDPSANVQTMLGSANNAAILSNIGAAALASPNFTGTPLAPDHGTAAIDMLINICYGTGSAPTANTTTEGTLFVKYTA